MSKKIGVCEGCGKELEFHWNDNLCWDCWKIVQEQYEEDAAYDREQERYEDNGT